MRSQEPRQAEVYRDSGKEELSEEASVKKEDQYSFSKWREQSAEVTDFLTGKIETYEDRNT